MLHDPPRIFFFHTFIPVLVIKLKEKKIIFSNLISIFRYFDGSKKFLQVVPLRHHLTCCNFRCILLNSLSVRLCQLEKPPNTYFGSFIT